MEGTWEDFRPTPRDANREMIRGGQLICRADIPAYLKDSSLREHIQWWVQYRQFGWPFAGGWAEQPAIFFDVIRALEMVAAEIESEKRKQAEAKRGKR
jgi:hypothetical protein